MSKFWHAQNRREFVQNSSKALFGAMIPGCSAQSSRTRPNILFVILDDLRPDLGCYGNYEIKTPHFDSLAQQGAVFANAYCQAAACAPSRASFMTGWRPDTTRVWSLGEKFRETVPHVLTMPQYFNKHGYHTVSIGKVFHNHMPDPISFDEPDLRPAAFNTPDLIDRDPESFYYDDDNIEELGLVREKRLDKNPNAYADGWAYGKSYEMTDVPDDVHYDGAQTTLAIETLRRIGNKKQPFFLAMGYYRPHLPFVSPKKYWDLYDRDAISLAPNPDLPKNSPIMAINSMYELRGCYDLEYVKHPSEFRFSEETARVLKHGYYASVSFVDACLGRLLVSLKELGLEENTIVVVLGDHGWKLGEHGSWAKQTNYNIDTRVPLIVRAPGYQGQENRMDQLVELVDLYPSLCDLAGIGIPESMEGFSFKTLLERPVAKWKSAVFSQYRRAPRHSPDGRDYMGYSMVTAEYHYVEWRHWDNDAKTPGTLAAVELYDLNNDVQENVNISGHAAHKSLVEKLAKQLKAGWINARPPV